MLKKIKKILREQDFSPGILGIFINPFYFARKSLSVNIKTLSQEITGRVLDIGCGTKPYKKIFRYTEYIGVEIDSAENRDKQIADFFYDGKRLPFKDSEFDSIIINQVLEHVFNPDEFLQEVRRVLKPVGKLLITVPFVWDEHEQPNDYARYSSYGLKFILESHGFIVLKQIKSLNNLRLIFQLLIAWFFKKINFKNKYLNFLIISTVSTVLNIFGIIISALFPVNNDLYLDNIILAEKDTRELDNESN